MKNYEEGQILTINEINDYWQWMHNNPKWSYKSIAKDKWEVIKKSVEDLEKEIEEQKAHVREIRNNLLAAEDKKLLSDFPISAEEKEIVISYRQYLRDYTKSSDVWYKNEPKTLEEYKGE